MTAELEPGLELTVIKARLVDAGEFTPWSIDPEAVERILDMSTVRWVIPTGGVWHRSKVCAESRAGRVGWKATPLELDGQLYSDDMPPCRVCARGG